MPSVVGSVMTFLALLIASQFISVVADHWPGPRLSLTWPFPRPADPAPVAAAGSLFAAIVAAVGVIVQSRRARQAAGLASLWRLVDRWDSKDMVDKRKSVAGRLLVSREPLRRRSLLDILNEFEMLGFLVCTSKALPLRDAWEFFSQWALAYWYAANPDVDLARGVEKDDTIYRQYEKLVGRLAHYEGKQLKPRRTAADVLERYQNQATWSRVMSEETQLGQEIVSMTAQSTPPRRKRKANPAIVPNPEGP